MIRALGFIFFLLSNYSIPQVTTAHPSVNHPTGFVLGQVSYQNNKTASYQLKIKGIVSSCFSSRVSELNNKKNSQFDKVRLSFLLNPDGSISNIKTQEGQTSDLHGIAIDSLMAADRLKPLTQFDDATLKANPAGILWELSFVANNPLPKVTSIKKTKQPAASLSSKQSSFAESDSSDDRNAPNTYYSTGGTWMGNINKNGSVSDTGGNWVGNVGRNGAVYDANCNWIGNINENGSISDPSGNWIGNAR